MHERKSQGHDDSRCGTGAWRIKDARVALGGVASFTQLAPKAAAAMHGQSWSRNTMDQTLQALSADVTEVSESTGELQMDPFMTEVTQ